MKKLQTIVSLILILSITVGCASKGLDMIEQPETEESSQESIEQSQVSKEQAPIEIEGIKENSSSVVSVTNQTLPEDTPPAISVLSIDNVSEIALKDLDMKIYYPIKSESKELLLNELWEITKQLNGKSPNNNITPGDRFTTILVIQNNYDKTTYTTFSNGIKINDDFYELSEAEIEKGKSIFAEFHQTAYADWLYWIKTPRVTSVRAVDGTGEPRYSNGDSSSRQIVELVRKLEVAPKSYQQDSGIVNAELPNTVIIAFDSGTEYAVQIAGDALRISSSDMNYSCIYTLMEPKAALEALTQMISTNTSCEDSPGPDQSDNPETAKPVIYLYPEKEQTVEVKLEYNGKLTYTFPAYNNGWKVSAKPDGTLTNLSDKTTHYYLFWEGIPNKAEWDFSKGSVVAGKDTGKFFEKVLPQMGLTPREYNDFIVFWTPILQENPYNLITFATEEYEELAKLEINPKPDSVLLVHMVFRPLEKAEDATPTPQQFSSFERKGFTVVEWGGTNLG